MNTEKLEEKLYIIKKALEGVGVSLKYTFNDKKEVYSFVLFSERTEQYNDIENALLIIDFENLDWLIEDINNTLEDYKDHLEQIGYIVADLYLKEGKQ